LTGIGSSWNLTFKDGKCPYNVGVHAIAEFSRISGCRKSRQSDVLTETDGGSGTRCKHWDDECLGNEIMTGYIGRTSVLSRITVASLRDLGYRVDYKRAEPFGRRDLNRKCRCKTKLRPVARRRRTVDDTKQEIPHFRVHDEADETSDDTEGQTTSRVISDDAHALAVAEGRKLLKEVALSEDDGENGSGGVQYVGDQMVTVFMRDGPHIFAVVVHKDQ
jgi:Leishmanolysin